ncbi:hypothetical protein QC762_0058440 [Podospora pseudocomata]|uniref:Uncharacterized protein n=1 Tax=Podospora pseudocomata TaxID=2093779 RepID=A0ABR0GKI1_9PEZI|nr:hypothetical protein QC762_0058440 [Podospora pseudocomata]
MENYLSGADTPPQKRGANKAGHILGGIMKTSGNKLWAATDPLSSNMAAHAWKPSRRSFLLQPRSALVIPGIPPPPRVIPICNLSQTMYSQASMYRRLQHVFGLVYARYGIIRHHGSP